MHQGKGKSRYPMTALGMRMNAGESIPAWRPARLRGMNGAPLIACDVCPRTEAQHGCEPHKCLRYLRERERLVGLVRETARPMELDPQAQAMLELVGAA